MPMKTPPSSFPDWIHDQVPEDDLFARAYQDITPAQRGLIKTGIAQLYDWYKPQRTLGRGERESWPSGFDSRREIRPVDLSVLLFDHTVLSPARLLAALVPAQACGVPEILALRIGRGMPWRKAVLTGLELAGQELVADATEAQARRLFQELRAGGRTCTVTVIGPHAGGVQTSEIMAASRISFWRPRFTRHVAIWLESPDSFDLEALAFIHPDLVFSVFGVEVELPADNFSYEGDRLDDFWDAVTEVVYVPDHMMRQALGPAKVVLCPGQEGCWVWPDLHAQQFQFHCIGWTNGEFE